MDTPAHTAAPDNTTERTSPLSLHRVVIDTDRENVAYLNHNCAVYRADGFQALSKIEVRANGRHVLGTLNVVNEVSIVACTEVGVPDGYTASVSQAEPSGSMASG